ncbi:hypothetical protein TcWFU_006205 [Taenia crassiceps]|uniref:tRNA-binding domain-containing protein n=1 Tax=Taenia crassiceps TaxID=6207 RepID=A0ABR4PYZ6_9CEST
MVGYNQIAPSPITPTIASPLVRQTSKPEKKRSPRVTKPKDGKKDGDPLVDVSRIDMRVGKIVEVERHPDAHSLHRKG